MKLAAPTMPPNRRSLALVIFLLVSSFTPRAMAQPEDVTGWQKTYRGMTRQELAKVYPEAVRLTETGNLGFVIEDLEIQGQSFWVNFFWTDDKLSGVKLTFMSQVYMPELGPRYEGALRSKYGAPLVLEDDHKPYECNRVDQLSWCMGSTFKKLQFIFPSTVIEYWFDVSKLENNFKEFLKINPSGISHSTYINIDYRSSQMDKL